MTLLLLTGVATTYAQTIKGTIYGGGEMAKVDGKTNVKLNTGTVEQDVFGGGKGKLNGDHTVNMSADVSETTTVTANGTTFKFPKDGIDEGVNHNIYGGGNLACKIGTLDAGGNLVEETGNTTVNINAGLMKAGFMDGGATTAWGKWIDAVNTRISTQHDNIVQGSVFGGGYGVNTSVMGMATVNINVANTKVNKAMVDVVGGGYNGYVLSKTSVTVEGVPEIYKIYGGGLGSRDGYTNSPTTARSHTNLTAYTMQQTIGSVGEGKDGDGTSLLIKGGKFYNDIFGGGAGLKYSNDGTIDYLNVAEVFGEAKVEVDAIASWNNKEHAFSHSIYGGGALGMVQNNITVTLKSGEFKYVSEEEKAQVFGGSLGEYGHLDKAKVSGAVSVITTNNDDTPMPGELRGTLDIYGGCDMAQVENANGTLVQLNYGQFNGRVFGGGLGRPTSLVDGSDVNLEYGKVIGNSKVLVDGLEGDGTPKAQWLSLGEGSNSSITKPVKIYGGGALGLVTGNIDVDLESGRLYGEVFAGSLGEMGYPEKAMVTSPGYGKSGDDDYVDGAQCRAYTTANSSNGQLTGNFSIYGGCDMAKFDGSTVVNVEHGDFYGKIFGGGKGVPSASAGAITDYGIILGTTVVNYMSDGSFNGDIYGGGALGLVTPTGTPEYTTQVNLFKGVLNGQVFGGGYGEKTNINTAKVTGNTKVETAGTEDLTGDINHVYGGGDMAQVDGNTKLVITHGQFSGTIFGGGHGILEESDTPAGSEQYINFGKVTGSTNVLINGAGLRLGTPDVYTQDEADAANTANGATQGDANYIKAGDLKSPMNIYGGGALGLVENTITVEVKSGEIYGAVFAGSLGEEGHVNKAKVTTDATITTEANDKSDPLTGVIDIYGACDMAQFIGNAHVDVKHGDFSGRIFGGGKGLPTKLEGEPAVDVNRDYGKVVGTSWVEYDSDGTFTGSIYGGGALGLVEDPAVGDRPDGWKQPDHITQVYLMKGKILNGYVFGGSLGEKSNAEKAMINGNTYVTTEKQSTVPGAITGNINKLYGGGDMAQVNGNTAVFIDRGNFTGAIYGGGKGVDTEGENQYLEFGRVMGSSLVTINDGSLGDADGDKISIYGGGALGKVDGHANVIINNGTIYGDIYGASYGETTHPQKGISGSTLVEILGGTTTGDVYGGGALASVAGNTEVHLYGGSIDGDVYGGGLGDENTYEEVGGSATVILGIEEGRTSNNRTSATEVKGSIFGANNVNGTPRGLAKVHVWTTKEQTAPTTSSYHVKAVYGGGNQSAYQPTDDDDMATVIVEFCDNSIQDVYGGGNAAPVPGTDVVIFGGTIDRVFAGGNGLGTSTTPGESGYNPGADIGWLNFYSVHKGEGEHKTADAYGSGIAQATIYGGIINQVFGGSNTLGYIRQTASVNVENNTSGDGCELNIGQIYGGGNNADIVGNIDMCLSCTEGADVIFAGANNANVYGDIHLTVNSGTFRQLFCGNNQGGAVFGSLMLDVDETGCTPVIIKELFGGGNLAPYSIYGYKKNAQGKYDEPLKTRSEFDALSDAEKLEQRFEDGKPYNDPVVNIYSCTAIGTVYGGGYGKTAMVYGNPTVNVDMVKGKHANSTITSHSDDYDKQLLVIKNGIVQSETTITIPDAIGTIGNIFGGGKQADVYGNTTVNVCVKDADPKLKNRNDNSAATTSALISPFEGAVMTKIMSFSDADKAANDVPTGSVYGGGKMANVFGNTRVHIRNGNIEGNVFGAGQGDAGQPDAALVQGKTTVIIGEESNP